jgi:sterol desaturase/sphingolipid hydroxylase (fatty acid hydroxylase superfamily)
MKLAQDGRERFFWTVIAFMMLFLGLNKQLDLQTMFTAAARCFSQIQGWYENRRAVQLSFIIALLIGSALFLATALWLMRGRLRRNCLAILGLVIVTAFVAVRAVGFHHVDTLIGTEMWYDIRYNVVFELSGLIAIAVNAAALLLLRQTTSTPSLPS